MVVLFQGGAYADIDGDGMLELLLSHGEDVPQPLEIYKVVIYYVYQLRSIYCFLLILQLSSNC